MKTALAVFLSLALAGCKNRAETPPSDTTPAVTSAAASAITASVPSTPLPAKDAWYAGTWSGTYESRAHKLDLSTRVGGLAEWAIDDGKRATGTGTLTVKSRDDGTVTGTAEGPLGKALLAGAFDGDVLALRFAPLAGEDTAFAGVVIARRDDQRLVGTLSASTPDGHVARDGTVTLSRPAH